VALDATLTFLFTDIEGSTRRWELTSGMNDRVEEHFAVLRAAIAASGGQVFATMGDGVAAAFTSAEGAMHAAIAAQTALPSTGLPVRMGIHTGQAQKVGSDYRGRTLNRAARIGACAHGGQILVSETSAALLRAAASPVALTDLGIFHLRDLSQPERLWQLGAPGLGQEFPPIRVGSGVLAGLPMRRSTLVGREDDQAAVVRLVSDHPLVTLVGMGGVGKTRLAIASAAALAEEFDVVGFIDLSAIEASDGDTEMVAGAIPAIDDSQRTLLVVDNCEQVLDATSRVLDELLSTTHVHVLATSRERLDLEGEHLVHVRPLDLGTSAVELFRSRAADAGLELTGEDDAIVRDICDRADCMPLAIELAAARAPSLGLVGLRAALDDCLDVLRAPRRGPERHSAIVRTIEWSTRLLSDDERSLFEGMAAFGGGFELDAAHHVAASLGIPSDNVLGIVDSLVAQSLIEVDHSRGGARYRMLWLVRGHALDALDLAGERDHALATQAEWVAQICDLPPAEPCSARVEQAALRLERELDNWRQAVQWVLADPDRSGLIGPLCGPPAAHFLLGRHDLAELVAQLPERTEEPAHRYAALAAMATSSAGAGDAEMLQEVSDELARLEGGSPSGMATLIGWIACTWAGQIESGVDLCLAAVDDERISVDMRDLLLAIATVDRFSLTSCTDRREELADRCLAVAARTTVRTQRAACLLGAAWASLAADADRARDLVELTLDEIPFLPSYLRQTLPGNVSRLWSVVDPDRAAVDLASRIENMDPSQATFAELIPMVYAAALLDRVGHPTAELALNVLRSSTVGSYVEILGLTGEAGAQLPSDDRAALTEVAGDLHAALVGTVQS